MLFSHLIEPFPPDGVNKTLTACEVGFSNTCQRRHKVDVKNCTDFLVYKLKALDVCNSAYCFGIALTYIKFMNLKFND